MKSNLVTIATGAVLLVALILGFGSIKSGNVGANAGAANTAITVSDVLVTGSSVAVVSTSTARTYLAIGNASTTGPIFCTMNAGKPAVAQKGIRIAANALYEVADANDNLYRGAVNCITMGGNASTSVFER